MKTYKAFRWVEFINFTPGALLAIQEEWKNIPQVETIDGEEGLVCFEFGEYVPKDPNDAREVELCLKRNNGLADFTMKRLKQSINKKCPKLHFSLKNLTIRNL